MSTTSHSSSALDEQTRRQIAGAIAEVDPAQMAITRKLTSAQRFQQAFSMIRLSEQVTAYRLRLRQPGLSESEALRAIRSRRDRI
jgi:hypothetical protein